MSSVEATSKAAGNARPIYVETTMACSREELLELTQRPELHQRWDLRFTSIRYLPRAAGEAQSFRYRTSIGPGLGVEGTGVTAMKELDSGSLLSTLRFTCPQRWSLLRAGAGYWRYEGGRESIKFLTRYSYTTRFGAAGSLADAWLFRPLMGWATAWSFDRLRLWVEKGWPPELTLAMAVIQALSVTALAGAWLFEGLVPKLLWTSQAELAMLMPLGWEPRAMKASLHLLGLAEVGMGLLLLIGRHFRLLVCLQGILLLLLAAAGAALDPGQLTEPFNPLTMTLPLLALSGAAWLADPYSPRASRCRRRPDSKAGKHDDEEEREI